MKKITLLLLAMFSISIGHSQTTLSQSVLPDLVDTGGVACWASGTGEYRDNAFARTYVLADFAITGDFDISAVEFGQGSGADGKFLDVNIYTVDTEDLSVATFTLISSTIHEVSSANDNTLVTQDIVDTVVPAGSTIAVEIFAPDEGTVTGLTFFPGFNTEGQNSTAWLRSDGTGTADGTGCDIPYSDSNTIVADPQEYVINLVGSEVLSVNENQLSDVSLYPNPSNGGTVSIQTRLAGDKLVQVYDVLGKQVLNTTVSNGELNISNLTGGVYMVKVTQDTATITKKLVIR